MPTYASSFKRPQPQPQPQVNQNEDLPYASSGNRQGDLPYASSGFKQVDTGYGNFGTIKESLREQNRDSSIPNEKEKVTEGLVF